MNTLSTSIPLSQSSLTRHELISAVGLVDSLQKKLESAGITVELGSKSNSEEVFSDIERIQDVLKKQVEVKPNQADQSDPTADVLESLSTTKEFLSRLRATPQGSDVTAGNESVYLLRKSVESIVGKTLTDINSVEYQQIPSSEELIQDLGVPVIKRRTKPKQKKRKAEADDEDLIKNQTPISENQAGGGGSYEVKKIPTMWKDFLKKKMLPIMPVVFVNGSMFDMHELYEKIQGESCWSEFELEERDLDRSRMFADMMMHDIGRRRASRDEYTDKDSFLPTIPYTGEELRNGIPCIPGFAPYKAKLNDEELTVERSLFGFYRLQDKDKLKTEEPIHIYYAPAPSLYYEERKDEVKQKKTEFLDKMEATKPHDFDLNDLPAEVSDEIICPGNKNSWRDQLRQMIIGLNLGYSNPEDLLKFDRHVGPYLSSHLASRRIGTCLHQAAIVSDMLSQLGKANFLTLGRYLDGADGHVQVWQYSPDNNRILKIEPTVYSTKLNKEQSEVLAAIPTPSEQCEDEETAYQLGTEVRSLTPNLGYLTGPRGHYEEYLYDRGSEKHSRHMHMMMREIHHHEDEMLCGKGLVPLRAALKKAVDRFQDGRADNLLNLFFSRKSEINSKIANRMQNASTIPQGPADITVNLIRAAFHEDKVHALDFQASYTEGGYGYNSKKHIVGDLLLKCDDSELKDLGTNRSQLHEILRRSPVAINTVFRARRSSYLSEEQRSKKALSKSQVSSELKDAEELLQVLTEGKISEFDPEQEPRQKSTLRDLCVSLIEIYALSNKVGDSKLKEKVIKAFGALGESFNTVPNMIDFKIFKALNGLYDPDTSEGFFTCIKEMSQANTQFKSMFSVDDNNKITLSSQGTSRFIEYWSDIWNNRDSVYEDFTLSAIYLGLLQKHGMLPSEVLTEFSESSKEILLKDILHKRYGLNPPISEYPLSQLQLLEMMKSEYSSDSGIAPAILKLREIGVIDDSYVSKEGASIEKAFSDSYKKAENGEEERSRSMYDDGQISYTPVGRERYSWWLRNIPLEILVAECPELRSSLTPTGTIFSRHHEALNYGNEGIRRRDYYHYASDSQKTINYKKAIRLWKEKYPDSFNDLVTFVQNCEDRNRVFWNKRKSLAKRCSLLDQPEEILTAAAKLKLDLMNKHFSDQADSDQLVQEAKNLRRSVYEGIDSSANWSNDEFGVDQYDAAVVATGDMSWLKDVQETIANKEQYQLALNFDTCARRPYSLSATEKSLRALMINESKVQDVVLDTPAIKNMAKQIAQEIKKRSTMIVSGNRQNGDQRGRRPSFDRTAEFSHYQKLTVPEAHKIDWKAWGRTDRFYERKTTSSENRGETVIFNIGKLRSLAEIDSSNRYYPHKLLKPTKLIKDVIKTLLDQGKFNEDTKFAIYSHGIPVAYFSLAELSTQKKQVSVLEHYRHPRTHGNEQIELDTPLERLIGAIMLAQQMGEAKSLTPIRDNASLLESSSDKKRLYGQKITLVTETDSAISDATAIQPLLKGQTLSVIKCNNDSLEMSA